MAPNQIHTHTADTDIDTDRDTEILKSDVQVAPIKMINIDRIVLHLKVSPCTNNKKQQHIRNGNENEK